MPAFAKAIAMPVPIVPAPTMAAFAIAFGLRSAPSPGILPSSRSAKKRWIADCACGPRKSSSNSRASCANPNANSICAAASIASISLCAATPPFSSAGTMPCAIAVMNGRTVKVFALARSFVPHLFRAISTART